MTSSRARIQTGDRSRTSRTPLRRGVPLIALVLSLPLLEADPALTQQGSATLQLMVVDAASGAPISGAQVIVDGGRRGAISDSGGIVQLAALAGHSMELELRMVGYGSRKLTAAPSTGQPLLLTVPLELTPIPLDPVSVEVRGPRSRELRDFYDRAKRGAGQYITRADIEKRHLRDLSDLFRLLPGIPLAHTALGDKPVMEAKASLLPERGGTSDCSVQYFLDGTPINPPDGVIGFDVELSEVEGIEVYRRGTGVPARFQRQHGSCGVILIWKRESIDG